jgi:hypothetical protein
MKITFLFKIGYQLINTAYLLWRVLQMTLVPLDEADPIYLHTPDQGQDPYPMHEAVTKEVEQFP